MFKHMKKKTTLPVKLHVFHRTFPLDVAVKRSTVHQSAEGVIILLFSLEVVGEYWKHFNFPQHTEMY